ncbi:MAG: hypothetical protein ABF741_09905, partial [Liquorilactobacillus ghanensis]
YVKSNYHWLSENISFDDFKSVKFAQNGMSLLVINIVLHHPLDIIRLKLVILSEIIKRTAYGFRNFEIFRLIILASLKNDCLSLNYHLHKKSYLFRRIDSLSIRHTNFNYKLNNLFISTICRRN